MALNLQKQTPWPSVMHTQCDMTAQICIDKVSWICMGPGLHLGACHRDFNQAVMGGSERFHVAYQLILHLECREHAADDACW